MADPLLRCRRGRAPWKSEARHAGQLGEGPVPHPWGQGVQAQGLPVAVRMGKGVHLTLAQDRCCLGASWKCGDPKVLLPQPVEGVSPLLRKGSF